MDGDSMPPPPSPDLSPPAPSQPLLLAPPDTPCCGGAAAAASGAVPAGGRGRPFALPRPKLRLTSEFDSESSEFFHKVSWKLLDGLAKLKLSFQNDRGGEVASPQLGFHTKNFSVLYDIESQNALLKGSWNLAKNFLSVRATHDVKEQQGEVAVIASLGDPSYKLELSSCVPSVGLPRATIRFPVGEVSVEEKKDDATDRVPSINGILKGHLLDGVCTALYSENDLNLRYCYKDDKMTFIPTVNLPSNALSFAFKRRFSPSDKLSYWYHFDSSEWSAVYKHTIGKDLKLKAGYDSEVRLGWASLWIGDEDGKTKTTPMKTKVQLMLQVPQDDINNFMFMFRVKKRWDF